MDGDFPAAAFNPPAERAMGPYVSSFSGAIGKSRMRFPVAWYTALAIAAATPTMPISLIPLTRSR
jgi:hypothetical protein